MSDQLTSFLMKIMIEGALEATTAKGRRQAIGATAETSAAIRLAGWLQPSATSPEPCWVQIHE